MVTGTPGERAAVSAELRIVTCNSRKGLGQGWGTDGSIRLKPASCASTCACANAGTRQKRRMRFLTFALAGASLVACATEIAPTPPAPAPTGPSVPAVELPSKTGVRVESDHRPQEYPDVRFDAFLVGPDSLSSINSNENVLHPVLDRTKWECPGAEDPTQGTRLLSAVNGHAFFFNHRCGGWSVSLENPSEETFVQRADLLVPNLTISADGRAMCFTDDGYIRTGKTRLTKGFECTEIASAGPGVYAAIDGRLVLSTSGDAPVTFEDIENPQGFQVGTDAIYFFDDQGLERLPFTAKKPELMVACDKQGGLHAKECPAVVVGRDGIYLARKVEGHGSEIVVRQPGTADEKLLYRTPDNETIYLPGGLARTWSTSLKHVWFILDWSPTPGAAPTKSYLAHYDFYIR